MHHISTTYVLCSPPIYFFLIFSSECHWVRSRDDKVLPNVVFSSRITSSRLGSNVFLGTPSPLNLQLMFITQCDVPICTPIQTTGNILVLCILISVYFWIAIPILTKTEIPPQIIFIVAPCIMDLFNLLHTNKCTVIL